VVFVDQSPIGKTARSNPVSSYVGGFDVVRQRFSPPLPLARQRGYTRRATSASTAATGAAPPARGTGFEHVEMQFLSDVYLRCPDCNGTRYRAGAAGDHQLNARRWAAHPSRLPERG
jgi:excinuclease ABC subunit A